MQALGLTRRSVYGRKNVLGPLRESLPLTAHPLIDRLPPVSTPTDWLTRTIFPADIDAELYTESHTESYIGSTDMEHTGAEP